MSRLMLVLSTPLWLALGFFAVARGWWLLWLVAVLGCLGCYVTVEREIQRRWGSRG